MKRKVRKHWTILSKTVDRWEKNWEKAVDTLNPYGSETVSELGPKRVDRELASLLDLPVAFVDSDGDYIVGAIEAIQLESSNDSHTCICGVQVFIGLRNGKTVCAILWTVDVDDLHAQTYYWSTQDFMEDVPKHNLRHRVLSQQFTARLVAEELEGTK